MLSAVARVVARQRLVQLLVQAQEAQEEQMQAQLAGLQR